MELDRYRPGFIVYTDKHALMTSDGTTTHLIAGNSTQEGYREGVGAEARFYDIGGFTQILDKLVVVADSSNHCMRLIDRTTNNTSLLSGQCGESYGYENGRPGRLNRPWSVVIDQRNKSQLLITESWNAAVRTVDVKSQVVGTFKKHDSLLHIDCITQEKSGDLYVTAWFAVYRITYIQKTVSLISGSPGDIYGYIDSTLLDSRFDGPFELILIEPNTLLISDSNNNKLRLVAMNSDKVATLNVTNSLDDPRSLLLTNNSLYVGQSKKITQC